MVIEKTLTRKSDELLARDEKHIAKANSRYFEIVAERASGSYLWDVDGKRYLDFAMGIAVNNVGHCHPAVVEATRKQIETLIHCSSVTHHALNIKLAEKLAEITPGRLDCTFFNNSGGEAVDAALKLARFVTGRPNIVAFNGSFHGRTLLATALTSSKSHYREGYEPLPSGIFHVDHPYCYRCPVGRNAQSCEMECFDLFERMFKHIVKPQSVAAIVLEPVQGEGGVVPPASEYSRGDSYMKKLRRLCDEHGIMLVFDEVQSGFGRTAKWFACNHWDVEPDIMIMAKGIASGFPMAGVIARKEIMDKWTPGRHGSTYGGNPVACAAALASIGVIEQDELLVNAAKMGAILKERLTQLSSHYSFIGDVRGLGLMIGMELIDNNGAPDGQRLNALVTECAERGLLMLDCGDHDHVVRLTPALNVSESEVAEALTIIEASLKAIA
jgi:4-aminobutyrate aminotransferase